MNRNIISQGNTKLLQFQSYSMPLISTLCNAVHQSGCRNPSAQVLEVGEVGPGGTPLRGTRDQIPHDILSLHCLTL